MLLVGFKPTVSEGEQRQTYALDRMATGNSKMLLQQYKFTLEVYSEGGVIGLHQSELSSLCYNLEKT
jgi:hypothetical protein